MRCATTRSTNSASPPIITRTYAGFPRTVEKKPFTVLRRSAIRSCLSEPVPGTGEEPFSVKPRCDNYSLEFARFEEVIESPHHVPVGHRPRHLDVAVDLGRGKRRLKAWLFPGPDAHEQGRAPTEHASELSQRFEPIRIRRQVMQDRDAQSRIERRISERQFRRLPSHPPDAHRLICSSFACPPNHEETQGEVERNGADASTRQDLRVPSIARPEIENPRAGR